VSLVPGGGMVTDPAERGLCRVSVMERRSCFSTFLLSARVLIRSAARFAISFILLSSAHCSLMVLRGSGLAAVAVSSVAIFVVLVRRIEFLVMDFSGRKDVLAA